MNKEKQSAASFLKKIPGNIYTLVFIIIVFTVICPSGSFLTFNNAINISGQCAFMAIVSIGSLLAIITGGIDLSVGGIMCFSGVVFAKLVQMGYGIAIGVLAALISGMLIGMLNGLIISRNNVAPFIITLASWNIADSLALIVSDSETVAVTNEKFRVIGGESLGFVPICFLIMIAVYVIFHVITQCTKFGTYIYAIGGNENAAHLTGINVEKVKFLVYTLSGCMAGLAGIVLASRLGSANPGTGDGYEFYGIASAVVGGASMSGGNSNVWNTLIGAVIISILRNGLNIAGIPNSWQMVVLGLVIIGVVFVDVFSRRDK